VLILFVIGVVGAPSLRAEATYYLRLAALFMHVLFIGLIIVAARSTLNLDHQENLSVSVMRIKNELRIREKKGRKGKKKKGRKKPPLVFANPLKPPMGGSRKPATAPGGWLSFFLLLRFIGLSQDPRLRANARGRK
jgi:hypothetical protein